MPTANHIQWKRLSIEGAAIIASILFAFAIDTWWEDRKNREDEGRYLVSLRQEFADSLDLSTENEKMRRRVVAAHESLIAQIQGANRAPERDLYLWISLVSYPLQYYPPRAVFNDITASGGTLLIRSAELRIALAEFEQGIRYLEKYDHLSWVVWEQRLQPFLEGRIPRVERLRQGLARDRGDVPFGQSPHTADFDGVFADPNFEDMIAERWLRLQNGLISIGRLISKSEEIVDLIDAELGTN
jgi:hypothetical protein